MDFFSCRDPQRMQGLCAAGVFPAAVALDPGYWLGSKVSMTESRLTLARCPAGANEGSEAVKRSRRYSLRLGGE